MSTVLNSLSSGLRGHKKKFKFEVTLRLHELLNCTFVSGVLFATVSQKDGGSFSHTSCRSEVGNHRVQWDQSFVFTAKMVSYSGELESCVTKVAVRKETRGGRSYKKIGFVRLNLAEYAGAGLTQRKYLLESYNETKHRIDNSILRVSVSLRQIYGDSLFKAPKVHVLEIEDEGIEMSKPAAHVSGRGISLGAGSLSLVDVKRLTLSESSLEGPSPDSVSVGSGGSEDQSTVTPHSVASGEGGRTRSNSLGSGESKPTIRSSETSSTLPTRSVHRRHTSVGLSPHKRQLSSSQSTSAYSTLSETTTRSSLDSISGSTRRLVPPSSKVEQSRVDTHSVIDQLLEGQSFSGSQSRGLQLFVDKTRGTLTLAGSDLDRTFPNLRAVDVSSAAHSRSSSTSGGSPHPPRKSGGAPGGSPHPPTKTQLHSDATNR